MADSHVSENTLSAMCSLAQARSRRRGRRFFKSWADSGGEKAQAPPPPNFWKLKNNFTKKYLDDTTTAMVGKTSQCIKCTRVLSFLLAILPTRHSL